MNQNCTHYAFINSFDNNNIHHHKAPLKDDLLVTSGNLAEFDVAMTPFESGQRPQEVASIVTGVTFF